MNKLTTGEVQQKGRPQPGKHPGKIQAKERELQTCGGKIATFCERESPITATSIANVSPIFDSSGPAKDTTRKRSTASEIDDTR